MNEEKKIALCMYVAVVGGSIRSNCNGNDDNKMWTVVVVTGVVKVGFFSAGKMAIVLLLVAVMLGAP